MDHVAIDLGGKESQICVRSSTDDIKLEKRLPTHELIDFFRGLKPCRVVLETCAEAFAVATQAKDAGHDVSIVPAVLVRSLGVGQRGIKTDQRDARALNSASTRVELASVHVPSRLSREMKATCGMRDALVASRTHLINNLRGWLRGGLVKVRSGGAAYFADRLREHYSMLGEDLPLPVQRNLEAIDALSKQIAAADTELSQAAKQNEDCRRLMSVPGVGPITAVSFVSAVDQVGRFPNAHRLQSYFGLTPGERSSSDTVRRTSLTKAGSKRVRWLLVQAAWSAFRTRSGDPMVLWVRRVADKRGTRIAVVALARKLAGIMFALLRDKGSYNAARGAAKSDEAPVPLIEGADVLREARTRTIYETEVTVQGAG